jgi:uncharacterized membrane protein YdbT with pleckstrin-like domain
MSIGDHLQDGEEILYQAYPSRVPLVPPLSLAALGAVAALVASRTLSPPPGWVLVGAGLVAAAGLVLALARYVRLAANTYVLTNRRLLRLSGILSRSSMDSYLDKINNVEHRQTLLGRLLDFGDLEIDTAAETGAELFPRISHPIAFKRAIDAATAAYHPLAAGRLPAAARATAPPAPGAAGSAADKVRQLKQLLDDGLISEAEFQDRRKQVLDQL